MTTTTLVRRTFFIFLVAGFLASSGTAQFNFARYRPITMDSLTKRHKDLISKRKEVNLSRVNYTYRATVYYGDSLKSTDPEIERLIRKWFTATLKQDYPESLFSSEMLFFENNVPYWIPVQQQLIDYFTEEVARGDRVEIFVTLLGATRKNLVLTLNEFKKLQ